MTTINSSHNLYHLGNGGNEIFSINGIHLNLQTMKRIVIPLPGNENLAESLAQKLQADLGSVTVRKFPDRESYVKINDRLDGKEVILVSALDRPDEKLLPLYFLSKTAKSYGAVSVGLVAPYLAYMRQDMRFAPGECVSADLFAELLSGLFNWLVTINPHLHRHHSLGEIYTIPTWQVQAAPVISQWIKHNIENPYILGPFHDTEQWIGHLSETIGCPYQSYLKGTAIENDKLLDLNSLKGFTPVVIDDIICTAGTMISLVEKLSIEYGQSPVCIGVHGIFADNAYQHLVAAGASRIITTNTIYHASNQIDITDLLGSKIEEILVRN